MVHPSIRVHVEAVEELPPFCLGLFGGPPVDIPNQPRPALLQNFNVHCFHALVPSFFFGHFRQVHCFRNVFFWKCLVFKIRFKFAPIFNLFHNDDEQDELREAQRGAAVHVHQKKERLGLLLVQVNPEERVERVLVEGAHLVHVELQAAVRVHVLEHVPDALDAPLAKKVGQVLPGQLEHRLHLLVQVGEALRPRVCRVELDRDDPDEHGGENVPADDHEGEENYGPDPAVACGVAALGRGLVQERVAGRVNGAAVHADVQDLVPRVQGLDS
mmetsp:Transcript_38043/g.84979  ORF Transcript_38043/g.84979 Transcript_38043/m.84979 type:complete len:272 (+) Transcript_38043:1483-2298(+)